MAITIEKHNFNNNEQKVLRTHMQLLIINTNKNTNVFIVKYLKKVMCSQLRMNTKKSVMIVEINSHYSINRTPVTINHKCSHPTH